MLTVEENIKTDYAVHLETFGLAFTEANIYYRVGIPKATQGWIIHLSSIPVQINRLLETVLPILMKLGTAFKVVKNLDELNFINSGLYQFKQIGKAVTIYPEDDHAALALYEQLIKKIGDFDGPSIVTDFFLGGPIYTRYGSFVEQEQVRFIIDGEGRQFADLCEIPVIIPSGVSNPFSGLLRPSFNVEPKLLNSRFLPRGVFKTTVKGNVIRALFFEGLRLKQCVIKQGRRHVISDIGGRDARDRLIWQRELHTKLEGVAGIPKIYDYFESDRNGYLAMEFIKGIPLSTVTLRLIHTRPWSEVDRPSQLQIIRLLIRIIDIIGQFHERGLVHRDIASSNFLVSKRNEVAFIDLELAFDLANGIPSPLFSYGTPGYTPPEQMDLRLISYKTDIYAFGALMIFAFTGVEPVYIVAGFHAGLRDKLLFLFEDAEMAERILNCMELSPGKRPNLKDVRQFLLSLEKRTEEQKLVVPGWKARPPYNGFEPSFVQDAFDSLVNDRLLVNGLWASQFAAPDQQEVSASANRKVFQGVHRGAAGVIYLYAMARKVGLSTALGAELISRSFQYLDSELDRDETLLPGGLHFGLAGIALAYQKAGKYGLYQMDDEKAKKLSGWLRCPVSDQHIIGGKAGQGLAVLQCLSLLEPGVGKQILQDLVWEIIASQHISGYWQTIANGGRSSKIVTGFGYGMAGIIYFLLEYAAKFPDELVVRAARKGLDYLVRQAKERKSVAIRWYDSDREPIDSGWWCKGSPGICLTFLKAYEMFGESRFRQTAEAGLRWLPEHFVHWNLTQCHGVSGLGEIYLEAARVLGGSEWENRANWIAELLTKMAHRREDGSIYWLTECAEFPTADLMVGMGGVLHFLLRIQNRERLGFLLLNDL
jgi:serine/threonine protein kinase